MSGRRARRRGGPGAERPSAVGRGVMVATASAVVAVAAVVGVTTGFDGQASDEAGPAATSSPVLAVPSAPSPSPSPKARPSSSPSPSTTRRPGPRPSRARSASPGTASTTLYRYPGSQVTDWVRAHPGDARTPVIEDRIASRPAAVWFADHSPGTVTGRVEAVTSAAAAQGRVPVLVVYAVPGRDCGGASEGGAPDLASYDSWIDRFAAGLGSGEVVVILEPDSVAGGDCLSSGDRAARFASLARAGRVLKSADPRARVYYDAEHSHWNPAAQQASLLRQAGAASARSSDGIFSNVSNFNRTEDEVAYDKAVLAALGGPSSLGVVIDTSRNGNGAPAGNEWCDPDGRKVGRAPTLATGRSRIDAYLWVKLPGESDGCKGEPGEFSPEYAYELAQ